MREIKFRAWDNKGKCMVPWGAMMQTAFNSGEQHFLYDIFCGHRLDVVLMQYTGLKDKNGKEIYEGDKVRIHNLHQEWKYSEPDIDWRALNIEWNRYTFAYNNKVLYMPLSDYSLDTGEEYEIEVIGNIYESPQED